MLPSLGELDRLIAERQCRWLRFATDEELARVEQLAEGAHAAGRTFTDAELAEVGAMREAALARSTQHAPTTVAVCGGAVEVEEVVITTREEAREVLDRQRREDELRQALGGPAGRSSGQLAT